MMERGQRGSSLIEMVIALTVLFILGASAMPTLSGAAQGASTGSYDKEQRLIQMAVLAYRLDPKNGGRYPTWSGERGSVDASTPPKTGSYIDFDRLKSQWYFQGVPASASYKNGDGYQGQYGWYVDGDRLVKSLPPLDPSR